MNTFMTVQAYGNESDEAVLQIEEQIRNLENYFSTTVPESDIFKINSAEGKPVEVHEETFRAIDFALNMGKKTEGALNIALYPVTKAWGFTTGKYKVPLAREIRDLKKLTDFSKIILSENTVTAGKGMALDLGSVGKGFAGDKAIEILKNCGVKSAILDLGGNIQTLGTKPDGSDWNVGIKDPFAGNIIAGIKVHDKAVITSGGYERFFTSDDGHRYIHIFDRDGYPVDNDLASVTVICESGLYGDSLSTSLFVMGMEKAVEFWQQNRDFEMILITNDLEFFYTSNLNDTISITGNFSKTDIIY